MARVAKSSDEGTKSPSARTGTSFLDWCFRPTMLVRIALIAGVCALWPYAAQRLPSLGKRPEYRLTFQQIQISPLPARPVPANIVEQVRELFDSPDDLSVLDASLTSDVANAFRQHPWISNVIRVRKSFPAAVTVELEYRQPIAMVQVSGGRIPIDAHAVVLPSTDFSAGEAIRYPLIQNVASRPVTHAGDVWDDPAVLAAARLANLLAEQWKPLKLEAILVPRNVNSTTDSNDIPLELMGQGGSRIVWGRAPGSDHPGELEPTQKIRRLEKYLADFGDYAKPSGPYEIDIRHWQEISRRPLGNDQAHAKPAKGQKEVPRSQISEGRKKTRS